MVGGDLTEADARALGLRVAGAAEARGGAGSRVVVGRDGRLSSPALVDGLVAGGASVERIGLGPTGVLHHAAHARGADAGVMVTGSHNPADQNGFKVTRV